MAVRVGFFRHSKKSGKGMSGGISSGGRGLAKQRGAVVGNKWRGLRVKTYTGRKSTSSLRTYTTAEVFNRALRGRGARTYPSFRQKTDLDFNTIITNGKKAEELMKAFKGDEIAAMRAWLSTGGKAFEGAAITPKEAARNFARRLAVAVRADMKGIKGVALANFSHSWAGDAFLMEVTGRSIEFFEPKGQIGFVEGPSFRVTKDKVTLRFRGKSMDVTQSIREKFPFVLRGSFKGSK